MLPRVVGLVTSGDGAAKADVLRNLRERHPGVHVVVVNSLVQGDQAPRQIVRAIAHLDARHDVEVIVLARGGGPLEDLMAFNSEVVCRAVAAAGTPIVSAIGHETDITLCDLVADLRVSTPTKAAEAVVPDVRRELMRLTDIERTITASVARSHDHATTRAGDAELRLVRALRAREHTAHARLDGLDRRLAPSIRGRTRAAVDGLGLRSRELEHAVTALMRNRREAVDRAGRTLVGPVAVALRRRSARSEDDVAARDRRLDHAARNAVGHQRDRLARLTGMHEVLSPARTVARGYAIVRDAVSGEVRTEAAAIRPGDRLDLELRDGTRRATVDEESE